MPELQIETGGHFQDTSQLSELQTETGGHCQDTVKTHPSCQAADWLPAVVGKVPGCVPVCPSVSQCVSPGGRAIPACHRPHTGSHRQTR